MSNKICKKFEPNRFCRIRCQNCFSAKNSHSAEALEQISTDIKPTHCGYLFISQDSDFSTNLARGRRWIRRYFVVYNDAYMKYFLDENIEGVPLADFDLKNLLKVEDAEEITTHANSVVLRFKDSVIYIKGVSKEEILRWAEIFKSFNESEKKVLSKVKNKIPNSSTSPRLKSYELYRSESTTGSWNSACVIPVLQKVPSAEEITTKLPESHTRSNLYGESAELEGLFYQKSGWLLLSDGNEWFKCWCKLKNGQFSVKMDGASAVDKLIDVKKCLKVEETALPFNFGFSLYTDQETLTFSATTESSRDSWHNMLDSMIITGMGNSCRGLDSGTDTSNSESHQEAIQQISSCFEREDSSVSHNQILALKSQLAQVQANFANHCELYCAERERSVEQINSLENQRSELNRRLEDVLEQFDKLNEEKDQIERSFSEATKLLEQRTEMYEMLKERATKMNPISDDEIVEGHLEGIYAQSAEIREDIKDAETVEIKDAKESSSSTVETLLAVVRARDINIAYLKARLSDVSRDLSDFHEQLMTSIENYKTTEDRLRADNERIARMVSKSLKEIEHDETVGGSISDCKLIHDLKVALCVKDFETQRLRAHVLMLEDEISLVLAHEEKTMRMYRLCLHEKNELTNLYNLRLSGIIR